MLIGIANADTRWVNTQGPLMKYNTNDAINATTATSDSIIMQKGLNQIWIYNGKKWQNTNFKKTGTDIADWNMSRATANSIYVKGKDLNIYHYDGKQWRLVTKEYPVAKKNISDIILGYDDLSSLLLITKDNQMFTMGEQQWWKIADLLHPLGAYTFLNAKVLIWDYATPRSSVYIYLGGQISDTKLNQALPVGEEISQSYFTGPDAPVVLTNKNNIWKYTGQEWQEIDTKLFDKWKTALNDHATATNMVMLAGINKPANASEEIPDIIWKKVYTFGGKDWKDTSIPLIEGEYIYEINDSAVNDSIVALTSLSRVLIYNGSKWKDSGLKIPEDFSAPDGGWNSVTAAPDSIVVGITNGDTTKFMLYNGKSWSMRDCQVCSSAMDASYQTDINSLIVISNTGQVYVNKD